MQYPMPSDTLDIALNFLKAHPTWFLFPIKRLEKAPPCFKNELELASNNPLQIRKWHAMYLGCNWGLSLKKSKVIVLDVDCKPGKIGQQTLDELTLNYGALPETLTVKTPSGGLHYYFTEGNGVVHRHRLGEYGFGRDIDSTNYVLIPGCWLSTGTMYETITDTTVAVAPEWFGEFLKEVSTKNATDQTPSIDLDKPENIAWAINYLQNDAPPSVMGQNGEFALLLVAGELKDRGISQTKAVELLAEYYNVFGRCDPLWEIGEGPLADRLDVKVNNAYGYLRKNSPGAATPESEFSLPANAIDNDTLAWIERDVQVRRAEWQRKQDMKAAADEARAATKPPDEYDDENTDETGTFDDPQFDDFGAPVVSTSEQIAARRAAPKAPITLMALFDKEPRVINKVATLCNEWVYCIGQERFVNRRDPTKQFKHSQFDSKFNPCAEKGSISKQLFSKQYPLKRFYSMGFAPGKDEVLDGQLYNVYRESPVKPIPGDTSLWNEHLNYLFQNEDDKNAVLDWLAWMMQNPTLKPNHALLIIGRATGTGKSFIARVMEQLVGVGNTQRPKNSSMGGDFNSWLLNCRLCIVEEVFQVGRRENLNAMRDLITEPRVEVNIKGIPAFIVDNYVCMMGISNHPDALPLDDSDRRWLVVETFAQPRDWEYYAKLFVILQTPEMLSAILAELLARDLGSYTGFQRPPMTEAKKQMIELSRSDAETWLIENAGNPPLSRSIVTIQDVKDAMPVEVQRTQRLMTTTIPNFLQNTLRGVRTAQRRLTNGTQARLWVLRDKIKMIPDEQLVSVYERERAAGSKIADESAIDDFGAGE